VFAYIVWVLGLILEGVLLFRAVRGGHFQKYPMFYLYVGCVLVQSLFLFVICLAEPRYYVSFYWYAEFVSVGLGCGVVWEIYRQALCRFPGAARMARNLLLFVVLMVFSKVLANTWNGRVLWPSGAVVALERDLRTVQAVLLIGLVVVITLYRIPLGRNLWGMMLGYGLFIGTSVITLALRVLLGDSFQTAWIYIQPMSYLTVLCIWCITLWSYKTVLVPTAERTIEQDYQLLAGTTRKGLLEARAYLGRAMRP
jgi:hypothetical protein